MFRFFSLHIFPKPAATASQNHRNMASDGSMIDLTIVKRSLRHSHTSLCGIALDPRGDRRGPHFIAAGNADVVPRHRLQPRDFVLESRHCNVDQPSHRHLPFPPTHLFNLKQDRECV